METLVPVLTGMVGGFIAGLGGPGGIPVISLLYAGGELGTAMIAGTASTIFLFATLTASGLYYRSGDIDGRLILPLVPTAVLGTMIGTRINPSIPRPLFGALIAIMIVGIGASVIYRELQGIEARIEIDPGDQHGIAVLGGLGLMVGVIGGIFGVGGPALSIPLLVFLGVPALTAIGAGLVQGIFITAATAAGYAFQGAVSVETAVLIGLPYILAQVGGWYLAQHTAPRRLKIALGGMLALLGPYLLTTI